MFDTYGILTGSRPTAGEYPVMQAYGMVRSIAVNTRGLLTSGVYTDQGLTPLPGENLHTNEPALRATLVLHSDRPDAGALVIQDLRRPDILEVIITDKSAESLLTDLIRSGWDTIKAWKTIVIPLTAKDRTNHLMVLYTAMRINYPLAVVRKVFKELINVNSIDTTRKQAISGAAVDITFWLESQIIETYQRLYPTNQFAVRHLGRTKTRFKLAKQVVGQIIPVEVDDTVWFSTTLRSKVAPLIPVVQRDHRDPTYLAGNDTSTDPRELQFDAGWTTVVDDPRWRRFIPTTGEAMEFEFIKMI
jgi:hypothetical protein